MSLYMSIFIGRLNKLKNTNLNELIDLSIIFCTKPISATIK